MFIVMSHLKHGAPDMIFHIGFDYTKAETAFRNACHAALTNSEEYTEADWDICVDEGWCGTVGGVGISFIDTTSCESDSRVFKDYITNLEKK